MKIKISELNRAALNWAVGQADGCDLAHVEYSTKWEFGGPIIEREGISIDQRDNWSLVLACIDAPMEHEENEIWVNGPTPLIAAMRCYVSSKLGDEIEIPEQLMEGENK